MGTVFPGTVLGAIMIQTIQAGLVYSRLDLYLQPMVMAAIIFLAVWLDSLRSTHLRRLRQRHIMAVDR